MNTMAEIAPIARSTYRKVTQPVWDALIWYVSQGATLLAICEHPETYPPPDGETDWPDRATIVRFMGKDPAKREEYDEAAKIGAGVIDEETQQIADAVDGDSPSQVQKAALRIKTRQWRAAHLDRARFGDYKQVEHSGERKSLNITVHAKPEQIAGMDAGPRLLNPAQPPALPESTQRSE